MSKRNRNTETAIIDPTESGPPDDAELCQADDLDEQIAVPVAAIANPESQEVSASPTLDCSTIVAGFDRQPAISWPATSPFQVDWPWGDEIDPYPGEESGVVGWNWVRGEIAVVTAVPPPQNPWPYTLTIEIRPMPAAWRQARVIDAVTGQRMDVQWYTRWNRASSNGGGRLAVMREQP